MIKFLPAFLISLAWLPPHTCAADRPHIVVIVADDLGYGDIGSYGAKRIPTPHLDELSAGGLTLTRCYASASTCTPTRYSMLTGEYAFRPTKRQTSILDGDAPLAIEPGSPTLPQVLRDAGYHTELVGKWHLGIGDGENPVDWNGHVGPGPLEVGFDHAFYIPATVDRVPCVFIEDHKVHHLDPCDPIAVSYEEPVGRDPIARERPELLKYTADEQHSDVIVNGIGRIGYMSGGHRARWIDENITDVLAERTRRAIAARGDKPLFLLLGAHDPHKPHLPHDRFVGQSQTGRRGDTIVQFDWLVGQTMKAIRDAGIEKDTLVFVTSDNGPAVHDGYDDGAIETLGDHRPAGPLRGLKYSVYEGGCRVPGIVYWPGKVAPGESDLLFSLIDLPTTLPRIASVNDLPPGMGPDAKDLSEVLLGRATKSPRKHLVLQGVGKGKSLVSHKWKYIPATQRGGSAPKEPAKGRATRWADASVYRDALYDLDRDVGEQRNVLGKHPEVAEQMRKTLQSELEETSGIDTIAQ